MIEKGKSDVGGETCTDFIGIIHMNLSKTLLIAAGVAGSLSAVTAQVYTTTSVAAGENNSSSYGISFTPSVDSNIVDLGAFCYQGYTTANVTLSVWHQGDVAPLGSTTIQFDQSTVYFGGGVVAPITSAGTGPYDFVFKNRDLHEGFTPVSLTAGEKYAIVVSVNSGTFFRNSGTFTVDSTRIASLDGLFNPGTQTTQNPFTVGIGGYPVAPAFPAGTVNMILAAPVPEPATYAAVAGLGLLGFAAFRKIRR